MTRTSYMDPPEWMVICQQHKEKNYQVTQPGESVAIRCIVHHDGAFRLFSSRSKAFEFLGTGASGDRITKAFSNGLPYLFKNGNAIWKEGTTPPEKLREAFREWGEEIAST